MRLDTALLVKVVIATHQQLHQCFITKFDPRQPGDTHTASDITSDQLKIFSFISLESGGSDCRLQGKYNAYAQQYLYHFFTSRYAASKTLEHSQNIPYTVFKTYFFFPPALHRLTSLNSNRAKVETDLKLHPTRCKTDYFPPLPSALIFLISSSLSALLLIECSVLVSRSWQSQALPETYYLKQDKM